MKLVVVGGHSRNIGKTSLVASLISATRELGWTALKITQFGHGICSSNGHACGCSVDDPDHPFSVDRETDREGGSDTSRFLRAGAQEVYWVRTRVGDLESAMPCIRKVTEGRPYVLMESNSVLGFVKPDVYLPVLQYDVDDFKMSSRLYLNRADAFVLPASERERAEWPGIDREAIEQQLAFRVNEPTFCSPDLVEFVRSRLAGQSPRNRAVTVRERSGTNPHAPRKGL